MGNNLDQSKMPLADALIEYTKSERISMHIPGHKRTCGCMIPELENVVGAMAIGCDITEIAGFDDYHEPEGIIKEAMALAAELFGADETYFIVNGTTAGLMAAVAAAAFEGERVLVASDCHKSITRGLVLSGADPVYISPDIDKKTGLPSGLDPDKVERILNYGGIRAIVLSNPSYYGTYSDLERIVNAAHKYGAVVIVDEAHGAHLRFTDQKLLCDAMSVDADISVQSIHKMLGSLTQSSMLHIKGDRIDRKRLVYNIRMLTSTSPSYLLMSSLDAVRHRMALEGINIWKNICAMVSEYSEKINDIAGMKCITYFTDSQGIKKPLDTARILISAEELGITGYNLSDILCAKYNIDMEMADDRYVLAVMGTAVARCHLDTLVRALKSISEENVKNIGKSCINGVLKCDNIKLDGMSAAAAAAELKHICEITPRKAVFSRHDMIEAGYASGRISAEEIAVYPPGIPLVVPGEKFTDETIIMITELISNHIHIHGVEIQREKGKEKIMLSVVEDETQEMLFQCVF